MKKTGVRLRIKSFPDWLINKFEFFHWKNWCLYCTALFTVGAVINVATQFSFPNFWAHQILLIAATTMLVYAMKSFFKDIRMFRKGSQQHLLSKVAEVSGLFDHRFLPLQSNPWIFLVAVIITVFFFSCIVLLEYIEVDVIGVYAIYIAGSSVLIGVYSYMQYLYFLWFIYQVGKCEFDYYSYNVRTPAESTWISQLAKTSQRLRNFFLLIGLIYVIEYSMLVPADKISFNEGSISLNTPNNAAFVISWVALFFLVIIAFPVINYVQHTLVVRVVNRLKAQTIKELSDMMFEEQRSNQNKRDLMFAAVSYSALIESVQQSKSYPIKRQLSYETLMTLVTFVVHIMNLYSKVASIPQLSTLLP